MLRFMVCLSLASLMLSGATPAGAAMKKSPAQIAAESNAIAERREACRLEAVEKKLSVLQRRKYIKECMAR